MSEISTVHSQSCGDSQSRDGDDTGPGKPEPSHFADESMTTARHAREFGLHHSQLPYLYRNDGPCFPDVSVPDGDDIIEFKNHPSAFFPLATLSNKLEKELVTWWWCKYPTRRFPGLGNVFSAINLLELLSYFARQNANSSYCDHAKDMSLLVCIQMLKNFETPIMYCSWPVQPWLFYRLRLAIHLCRNDLAELSPDGGTGRLASFEPVEDDVILEFKLLVGGSIKLRLSWAEVTARGALQPTFNNMDREMTGISSKVRQMLAFCISGTATADLSSRRKTVMARMAS
jgi:hypothetical protein